MHLYGAGVDIREYTETHWLEIKNDEIKADTEGSPFDVVMMDELEKKMPTLENVALFQASKVFCSEKTRKDLKGFKFDKAYFLYQHALEFNYGF